MVMKRIKIISSGPGFRSHYKRIDYGDMKSIGSSEASFSHEEHLDLAVGSHSVIYTTAPETYDWFAKIYVDGVLIAQGYSPIEAKFEVLAPPPRKPVAGLVGATVFAGALCVVAAISEKMKRS